MVATRSSSAALGTPSSSRTSRSKGGATTTTIDIAIPISELPTTLSKARTATPRSPTTLKQSVWSHTPSPLTLLWLTVSLPLVAWDTGYVLLRPHSMPGGSLHWPLWTLYDLYGKVDHVYGFKAWDAGNGFTGAQGMMNLIETVLYGIYWGLWVKYGVYDGERVEGTGGVMGKRRVGGKMGGLAVVVGFGAAVMTLSKTVLYCEYIWWALKFGVVLTLANGYGQG